MTVLTLAGLQETAQICQAPGSEDKQKVKYVLVLLFSPKGNENMEKSVTGKMDRENERKSAPWHGRRGSEHYGERLGNAGMELLPRVTRTESQHE